MNKSKQKNKYDGLKALCVKNTAEEFECTEAYVRMCIAGTTNNGRVDEINKYFQKKYKELSIALNK